MSESPDQDGFYQIRHLHTGIRLCFVNIPDFARRFIPGLDLDTFRRQKQQLFDSGGPLGLFFSDHDFQRINRFKVLKKQVEWMAGKIAVKILAEIQGLSHDGHTQVAAEESGAPFLTDFPRIPISISHSGDYAVAAMGHPGQRLALDIERVEAERMRSIMHVAFSDREQARLSGKSDKDLYLAWTMKEAFLKYIKKGFSEGLKKVEIMEDRILYHGETVGDIEISTEFFQDDYAFSLIYRA